MGRIKKGILGGFSGKVGSVVGASWRGIDYMRSLPRKSNKPATVAQLAQQNKMALFRGFLLGVDSIVEKCFQNIEKCTRMNDALSYNMLNSIEGIYPEQSINFANFMFSKGELRGVWSPKVDSAKSNTIDFSWENGYLMPLCAADDQVMLVVYDPAENYFCNLQHAAQRADKKASIILPKRSKGHSVHCYISFYSERSGKSSTNEYLGQVLVA
jgi:hypothetical protein